MRPDEIEWQISAVDGVEFVSEVHRTWGLRIHRLAAMNPLPCSQLLII